jgi:hypothetical protein
VDFDKLGKLIDQWKTLLTGLGVLLAAGVAVWKQLISWDPWTWTWREILSAALAALLLAIITLRSRKSQVSRLIDPDALKLDPQSPEQLVGRAQDLNMLLRALANPLVFLVSESGCGKSTLLRAGVVQGPEFNKRFLPVYIDMSVLDWEDGPLREVREGFTQALPMDDPARGKLDARASPRQYAEAFGEYYRRTQRRLLLLLDQFDDYQAQPRHREHFLPPDTRVWRNADSIARENSFWRMLRQCLQSGGINVIVACREDAAQGLESLRFHPEVPQFDLPRLQPGLVRLIIDRLAERTADEPPVIAEPNGGWTALRDRLVDDLEARGQVLPQQLKVALGGLRTLHRLTPAAYARAGRLPGLEAAFVAGAITGAARMAALHDEDVLRLLLPLVDRTRQPPDKGPPQSQMQLAEEAQVPGVAAGRALKRLEADEVVRPRSELEEAAIGWQLDHAYLAQPILRIERERDLWHQLLTERARTYAEASWQGKWRALLPLGLQARLVGARLQRRFRYGEQRGYALKSLSRALPAILVVGAIAGLSWAATEWDAARQIEGELARNGDPMSDDATAGLANLAGHSWVARWRVARDIFSQPQDAGWFAAAPGPVLRAWVRLDPDRLDNLVRAHVTPESLKQTDPRLKAAAVALVGETSPAALADGTRASFERTVGDALRDPKIAAVGGLVLAGALSDGDPRAVQWLAGLREAISKTIHDDELEALAQAYAAVAGKLKEADPHAVEELAALREAISKTTDDDQLEALAQAYAAVAGKLKEADPHVVEVLSALRQAVNKTTLPFKVQAALARAYAAVAGALKEDDPHASEVLAALREAIVNEYGQPRDLAQAYAAVAGKSKEADPHAAEVLTALREAIGKTTYPFEIPDSAQAYAAVAGTLKEGDPHAAEVFTALHEAFAKTTAKGIGLDQPQALARAYAAVAGTLKEADPHTGDVLVALREAISKTTHPFELPALAQAYAVAAGKLKEADPHAAEELAALREAISKPMDPGQPQALAQAYAAVAGKLKEADPHTGEVLAMLREGIAKPTDPGQPQALAQAYAVVAGTLNEFDPHAAEVLAALRDAIGKIPIPSWLPAFAQAYAAVAGTLKEADPHAAEVLAVLREAIGKIGDQNQLQASAQAYAAVAKKARPATAPVQDIAVLLARIEDLRSAKQCEQFVAAILAAMGLGSPPLAWQRAGLVVAAVLLKPISAGAPTRELVEGYEKLLNERPDAPKPDKSWSGDVWAFVSWARDNLPGFDRHQPNVGFLPSVALSAQH